LPEGVLIRGANITVKSSYYPRPWHNLWLEWDWDNWIKWQVDLARTLGANCIRVVGSVSTVAEEAVPLAEQQAHWAQLLDYLATVGMYAYPCPSDLRHWGAATLPQAVAQYRALGGLLDGYANVIGVDVSNEAAFALEDGRNAADLQATLSALTAALQARTSKPLTHSVSLGNAQEWFQPWVGQFTATDFVDVHLYYTPAPTDAHSLFGQSWGDRPLIIGEFGIGIDEPSSRRTARYLAVKDLMATDPRFVGALAWDIASDNFGLFGTDGRPRTDITSALETFPVRR
jgi:hypothetical protein